MKQWKDTVPRRDWEENQFIHFFCGGSPLLEEFCILSLEAVILHTDIFLLAEWTSIYSNLRES